MRRTLLAVVLIGSLALAVLAAPAGASPERRADAAADARQAEHRRIADYWTAERRAAATPREIVLPLGSKPQPMAKPSRSGSGDSGGSTWSGGGDVVLTTGKVFFTLNGTNYVCSGSAVRSAHENLVLTAGHCLHNGGGGGPWATNWAFYPAYNSGTHPRLGVWTATDLYTTSNWHTKDNWYDDDAGFAIVFGGGDSSGATDPAGTLEDEIMEEAAAAHTDGTANIPAIDTTRTDFSPKYYAFGYPAAGKYNGQTLTYCSGSVSTTRDSYDTLSMACNMTGGSSGGPWLTEWNDVTKTGTLNSVNSYGYSSLKNVMFGPIFGAQEGAAYQGAQADCTEDPTRTAYACDSLN